MHVELASHPIGMLCCLYVCLHVCAVVRPIDVLHVITLVLHCSNNSLHPGPPGRVVVRHAHCTPLGRHRAWAHCGARCHRAVHVKRIVPTHLHTCCCKVRVLQCVQCDGGRVTNCNTMVPKHVHSLLIIGEINILAHVA